MKTENAPHVPNGDRSCPVDFDHDSPDHARNWVQNYHELRAQCPRAWTENYGGYWVATRYHDILGIVQNKEDFSTHKDFDPATGKATGGVVIPTFDTPRAIPQESDPPEWRQFRMFLNPKMSPKGVEERRPAAKRFATMLMDRIIETGRFDIVEDFTSPLPAMVMMDFFGFPLDEWPEFSHTIHAMVFTSASDPAFPGIIAKVQKLHEHFAEAIAERKGSQGDDLLHYLANGEIDGEPISVATGQEMAWNLITGGVDTTTALTANALLHLHRNHDDRRTLIEDREKLGVAREEFVRFFSPIHSLARNVKNDTQVNGWDMKAGDRVLLPYAAANRDPEVFDDPDLLKIDRYPNRHIGFGGGIHRCLGSFLARMMFETMMDEILDRIPDYVVNEDLMRPYTSVGGVNGWITMPATFTPGRTSGQA